MKLVNHTLVYLSGSLFVIIGVWAVIFYFSMLDEVRDSIDDGLDNYKMLIIQKAKEDSTLLHKIKFDESNYRVKEITQNIALNLKEHYTDTLMYMQNEQDFEPVRLLTTVFASGNNYYKLDVIASMVEEDDLIEDLSYALVWLYLIVMISIVIINNLVLKKIWKPFYFLLHQLKNFRLHKNTAFTVPETQVKEFKSLNETVMDLLKSNVETYTAQKQFIENAAHELQTPLAISINKLELLAEESTLNGSQVKAVADVLETLERLTRLNRSLLLLSKIENRQFAEEEDVNFNDIVKQQLSDFEELISFKEIAVNFKVQGVFTKKINRDLAIILTSNLLKNTVVHTLHKGTIDLEINERGVKFSNSGKPKPLDRAKLFKRFYKDPSKKGSTGLGLPIAKAIADLYHISLTYVYDKQHHFILKK